MTKKGWKELIEDDAEITTSMTAKEWKNIIKQSEKDNSDMTKKINSGEMPQYMRYLGSADEIDDYNKTLETALEQLRLKK